MCEFAEEERRGGGGGGGRKATFGRFSPSAAIASITAAAAAVV